MDENTPLYNSRIIRSYVGFLQEQYPHLELDDLFGKAGITFHQVDDPGHWFSQRDVDSFQKVVAEATGNQNISREAGRNVFNAPGGVMAMKQYTLGLLDILTFSLSIEKVYDKVSRGVTIRGRKLGSTKVEIVSKPKPGVKEKLFQCKNRMGSFESMGAWFTGKYPKIEHPECYHRGDACCRYIISWDAAPLRIWKRARNFLLLVSPLFFIISLSVFPLKTGLLSSLFLVNIILALFYYTEYAEKSVLKKNLVSQGNAASALLEETNIRYSNALLVQEIGQATSTLTDIRLICAAVMNLVEKNLDFDRGMIMLPDKAGMFLGLSASFGLANEQKELLAGVGLDSDPQGPPGIFSRAFNLQKPFLANDIKENDSRFSPESQLMIRQTGVQNLLCVPIIYERESLGVLAVDKGISDRSLTQSDINLMMGVASHTAASIANARSFQRLHESEQRHRTLIETVGDIVYMIDPAGFFTYVSPIVESLTGHLPADLVSMPFSDLFMPRDKQDALPQIDGHPLQDERSRRFNVRTSTDRRIVPFEINSTTYFDVQGRPAGSIGVARDITLRLSKESERQEMEIRAMAQSKLASLGEIATGIAHEINQPLSYIRIIYESALRDLALGRIDSDELQDDFNEALRQVGRIVKIIDHLRVFGRTDLTMLNEDVDLGLVLENTLILMRERIRICNISLITEVAEDLPAIRGNYVKLEQVLINLLQNAIDVLEGRDDGEIRVALEQVDSIAIIRFTDNGSGIAPEHQDKIFEPFFTTKEVGQGTGIGLSLVYGVVREHHGYIVCNSKQDQGTEFVISLPVSSA